MRVSLARNPAIGAAWLASLLLLACGGNNDDRAAGDRTGADTTAAGTADTFGAGGSDTAAYGGTQTDTTGAATGADTASTWSQPSGAARNSTADTSSRTSSSARRNRTSTTDTAASSWSQQADTSASSWSQPADTSSWSQQNQQADTSSWSQQQDTSGWNQQAQADTSSWSQQNQQADTSAWSEQNQQDTTAWAQPDTTMGGDSAAAQRSSLTNQTTVDSTRPVTADSVAVSGDTSQMGQAGQYGDTSQAGQAQQAYGDTSQMQPSYGDTTGNANAWAPAAGQDTTMGMGAGAGQALNADSLRRLGWVRAEECNCQQQGQVGQQDTTQSGWRGADSTAQPGQNSWSDTTGADSAAGQSSYQQQNYQSQDSTSQQGSFADSLNASAGVGQQNSWADTSSGQQSSWADTSSGAMQDTTGQQGAGQDTSRAGMGAGAGGDSTSLGGLDLMTLTNANMAALLDEANVADSTAGAFAFERAKDDEVKRFAKMMMSEHHALRMDAEAQLQRIGLTPEPPAVNPVKDMHQQGMATLQSTPEGKQFDQAYIDHEVRMHEAALQIAKQGRHSSRNQAQIQPIIEKATPVIKEHLEQARELQKKVGKPGSSEGSDSSSGSCD